MLTQNSEHFKNKKEQKWTTWARVRQMLTSFGIATLGPSHAAPRIVRPVAVDAGDAPLHAPGRSDHAGALADRIVDHALDPVGRERDGAAIAPRDGVGRPRPKRCLAHLGELDDLQARVPEAALLGGEPRLDLAERG